MGMGQRVHELRSRVSRAATESQDAVALQALASLEGPFLPWTEFSMRPAAILAVVSDVAINDRRSIVECGSGNSTIFTARLLRQRDSDGTITTIDHDEHWAALTRRQLEAEGLTRWATVLHAPLEDGWYARSAVPEPDVVDLLVVDGPPAHSEPIQHAREPALDAFHARLAPDATIVLDDATRPGEREVIRRWSSNHGRTFAVERGGFAISAPHTV
jgi:predicted O-methyltransferase YrrM